MAICSSLNLVTGVLAGETRAIARLLTRVEAGLAECQPALDKIFCCAGRAHIIGVTGVAGCGKSTLVAKLVAALRHSGKRVAVVAVDPSSPFSGGAILGDRIRMGDVAGDPGVFVRSMATRGALGGLSRSTLEAVDVFDAAGFDQVIIETVGVGQDEVDVVRAAHTTVVVSAPGLGDDIQTIKSGVLEIADIHVVSKCDRPDAHRTIADLKNMLALSPAPDHGQSWQVPVMPISAIRGDGVNELRSAIDRHWNSLFASGEIENRCRLTMEWRLLKTIEMALSDRFNDQRHKQFTVLLEQLQTRSLGLRSAAQRLLEEVRVGGKR